MTKFSEPRNSTIEHIISDPSDIAVARGKWGKIAALCQDMIPLNPSENVTTDRSRHDDLIAFSGETSNAESPAGSKAVASTAKLKTKM